MRLRLRVAGVLPYSCFDAGLWPQTEAGEVVSGLAGMECMGEEMIRVERVPDVLILRLSRGVTNALDPDLLTRITQVLEDVKRDSTVRGLVLAGANDKFFSIGFDIPQLIEPPREELGKFYELFNQTCVGLHLCWFSEIAQRRLREARSEF